MLVTYTYDAFGANRSQSAGSDNAFLFAGEQRDDATGFDYLRARYYDPAIGRFLSRDPAGPDYLMPQTLNRFAYVLNNPVNLTDPSGRTHEGYYELHPETVCILFGELDPDLDGVPCLAWGTHMVYVWVPGPEHCGLLECTLDELSAWIEDHLFSDCGKWATLFVAETTAGAVLAALGMPQGTAVAWGLALLSATQSYFACLDPQLPTGPPKF